MVDANIKIKIHVEFYVCLWGKYLEILWIYISPVQQNNLLK